LEDISWGILVVFPTALSASECRCKQTHKQATTHTRTHTHTHTHTHICNSSTCCHILKLDSVMTILKYWTMGLK